MKAHQLLAITRRLKGVQLDQFESLIDGSDDPDDYNPNALRQIGDALLVLHTQGLLDTEDFHDLMPLIRMMTEASE